MESTTDISSVLCSVYFTFGKWSNNHLRAIIIRGMEVFGPAILVWCSRPRVSFIDENEKEPFGEHGCRLKSNRRVRHQLRFN